MTTVLAARAVVASACPGITPAGAAAARARRLAVAAAWPAHRHASIRARITAVMRAEQATTAA